MRALFRLFLGGCSKPGGDRSTEQTQRQQQNWIRKKLKQGEDTKYKYAWDSSEGFQACVAEVGESASLLVKGLWES